MSAYLEVVSNNHPLTSLLSATKNKQAREQICEIFGPVLLIFVSLSITGVRTTDKMYQTREFSVLTESNGGCHHKMGQHHSKTEPTGDPGLDEDKFLITTLIMAIVANKQRGRYACMGESKQTQPSSRKNH